VGSLDVAAPLDVSPLAVDALPVASEQLRGRFYLLKGASGVTDVLYVCAKTDADVYDWTNLSGMFGV
jgi:hypothetical protein